MKITFLGDIMCEPYILKASRRKDGSYDFSGLFTQVKPMLAEADYVISNLEFPMAGEEAEYTKGFFVFNAPDSYAQAAKDAGIDLVSTVNNHTFDRGEAGMLRTIHALDEIGLPHTGTFLPEKGREEAYYFTLGDTKFAVVAYSYACNKKISEDSPCLKHTNLLRPQGMSSYTPEVQKQLKSWVDRVFKKCKGETRCTIRRLVGLPNTIARADDFLDKEAIEPYVEQFRSDIRLAKQKADFVICYPHIGGQFNPQPGKFSQYIVEQAIAAGADAVVCSHSHMVQKAQMQGNIPVAYSLGNFSMSGSSSLLVDAHLPHYGLALHLYLDGARVEKMTFTILKAVEDRKKNMVSWPVDALYETLTSQKEKDLLEAHVRQVYRYATGKDPEGPVFRREYTL